MVQKVLYVPNFSGPCGKVNTKRLLSNGVNIEQRPWTPTTRQGKLFAEAPSPGPACVLLPPLVGGKVPDSKKVTGPLFSFGRKLRSKHVTLGPGPAQYDTTGLGKKGKNSPPASSIRSRPEASKAKLRIPAPGEYNVAHATNNVLKAPPRYSFGHKHRATRESIVPAPNVYKIPTIMGNSKEGPIRSAPAFSMAGRNKPRSMRHAIPGPGDYDCDFLVLKRTQPMYTLRDKYDLPTDTRKPGPGAYCPENYLRHKSTPAPTMGIKHSPLIGIRNPYLIERPPHCENGILTRI